MPKKSYFTHILGIVFRGICILLIASVVGILAWRLLSSGDPKSMKTIIATDELVEAYGVHGEDMNMFSQSQIPITTDKENRGYFSVTRSVFIEEAEQLQLVFRYNNSTIKHLKEDYTLDELPDRKEDLYDASIVIAYDLTPEDKEDNENNENIKLDRLYPVDKYTQSDTKNVYNYRKYVFNDVKIDDSVLFVDFDVYYLGDLDYKEEAYGALRIYDAETENEVYKWTSADKKELEQHQK